MSQIKPSYDDDRQILADIIPLKSPLAIQITPSSVCNFRCTYCIHHKRRHGWAIMDWKTTTAICEQVTQFERPLKQVTIAGWGEPMVNRNLPAIIRKIRKEGITERISLVTNASLFTKENIPEYIDSGLDFIKISLQGLTSEKYKEISRASVDFGDLCRNIRYLYDNKKQCQIFVKVPNVSIDHADDVSLFYSEFEHISDRMYVEVICPVFEKGFTEVNKFGQYHSPILACPHPFYNLNVTAEGDILPCCSYYDPTMFGNVHNVTLKEVWESTARNTFLKMLLSRNRLEQTQYMVCKTCQLPDMIYIPGDDLDERAEELKERI